MSSIIQHKMLLIPMAVLALLVAGAFFAFGLAGPAQAHTPPSPEGDPTTEHIVTPDFVEGNPGLCASSDAPRGFRINSPGSGQHTDPGNTDFKITLTIPSVDGIAHHSGSTFDFVVDQGGVVENMNVKGGPNANDYDWVTDDSHASGGLHEGAVNSDRMLHSPLNENNRRYFGLSHIDVCHEPGTVIP